MDFLEEKNIQLWQRLKRLQVEQCCLHIDEQIGLWYRSQIDDATTTTTTTTTTAPTATPTAAAAATTTLIVTTSSTTTTPATAAAATPPPTTTATTTTNATEITATPTTTPVKVEQTPTTTTPAVEPTIDTERTIGCFLSNIKHLKNFDSDATESTSSDSYDELEDFSHEEIPPKRINHYHNHPSTSSVAHNVNDQFSNDLKKRAIWKWANERSRLASRWTWLQAQIADLEFRIRGQNDATIVARAYKTPPLPTVLPENSCSRSVPISGDFRRRRLIKSSQILSDSNKKLVKFSHVPCICSSLPQTVAPCLSCNGRYNYLRQLEGENAPLTERISLLDPCCHPVLSFPDDLTLGSQLSYLLKQETINRKPTKGRPGRKKGSTAANLAAQAAAANSDINNTNANKKGKYYPRMVGRPPGRPPGSGSGLKNPSQTMITSNKLRRKYRKHSNANNYDSNKWVGTPNHHTHSTRRNKRIRRASSINESSICSESSNQYRPNHFSNNNSAQNVTRRRRSEQSAYDIDNIVIPFSIAATTRVEILEYKEIMTPSWRVWENGTCQVEPLDEDVEDTSDEAYILRHSRGECEERKRFSLRPPKNTTTTATASALNNNSNNEDTLLTNNSNNETTMKKEVA